MGSSSFLLLLISSSESESSSCNLFASISKRESTAGISPGLTILIKNLSV